MPINNMPPTAPTVITPNGGELWNSSHTVEWLPANDIDIVETIDTTTRNTDPLLNTGNDIAYQEIVIPAGKKLQSLKVKLLKTTAELFKIRLFNPANNAVYKEIELLGSGQVSVYEMSLDTPLTFAVDTKLQIILDDTVSGGAFDVYGALANQYTAGVFSANGATYFDRDAYVSMEFDSSIPQNQLRYQIQLTINNGTSWSDIISLTSAGAASHLYDFINTTETSMAKIRVRAYDGTLYGNWDESDGVFTIQHNVAPTIPSSLTPSGIPVDRLKTRRLAWQHNDSPNDIQSKADIQWRHQGDALWTSLVSEGPDQEYFIPPNTFPNGQTEWRVRTYDSASIVSPWSNVAVFTAAEPTNAPTIIQPTGSVSVSRPVVEWTSATQSSYQIVIEDSLGATVWDTGEITSAVKARTVGIDLLNGGTYKVKVRIKDGSGLFSSFADVTFVVSYTAPAKPTVQAFPAEGAIAISIDNPTPTGTQPSVLYSDVYRDFDGVWKRIATNVNVAFTDYAVASGITYKYRIQTHGNNGTSSYSDVVSASVTVKGAWIHAVRDAESTATNFRYNGVGYDTEFTPESVAIKFAGRRRPVIQFGIYEDYALSVTIQSVDGMDDMNRLRSFVRNRELICYRDSDGNLLYGIIPSLPITKEYRVSSASITIIETEFNEEV